MWECHVSNDRFNFFNTALGIQNRKTVCIDVSIMLQIRL